MAQHPDNMMDVVVKAIAESRYDVLCNFLTKLSTKLKEDSAKDKKQGRTRLASNLHTAYLNIAEAAGEIGEAWTICEKYMK